jgi:hypothetical protein
MALEYFRQNPLNDLLEESSQNIQKMRQVRTKKKISKGKFSLLLGGNLVVWVFFFVSVLNLTGFSMNHIPVQLPQTLSVSGIVYSETSPHAIISKEAYGVGDVVSGWKIVDISRTEVRFEKDGKTLARQVR